MSHHPTENNATFSNRKNKIKLNYGAKGERKW